MANRASAGRALDRTPRPAFRDASAFRGACAFRGQLAAHAARTAHTARAAPGSARCARDHAQSTRRGQFPRDLARR